jgi:hypothetical protein
MKKWVPAEDETISRNYVDLLRQGKFEQIEHDFDPTVVASNPEETLGQMAAIFPNEIPESTKVVGAYVFHGPEYSTTDITLEYQFKNKWLLANVVTKRQNNVFTVLGFHVNSVRDSLENQNRFTLLGKGGVQYLILALAICSLMFSLYVLVLCVRTRNVKAKWLWILFILAGVGRLAVNWTSGEWAFSVLAIHIPCATAGHPLYASWTVEVFLPLGAILFLNHRWKMKVTGEVIDPLAVGPK